MCLGQCEYGASQAEQIWYGFCIAREVEAIMQEHLVGMQSLF
jgi:(2Fe-2S) ferredoxin